MLVGPNMALLTTKAHRDDHFAHASVCQTISEVIGLSPRTASNSVSFPLYLYPQDGLHDTEREINFDPELYARLREMAEHPDHGIPDEVAVFDYIYGVLHCPAYRDTYSEYLKTDFPRIPWPSSPNEFWRVSSQGAALRRLHLMEPAAVGVTPYRFQGDGDNVVATIGKNTYRDGKVWINKTQYFADIPQVAWNLYVGGYQPAQKWLKDRKGRALTFDDVKHYQRIIKVLTETDRIMSEIHTALEPV